MFRRVVLSAISSIALASSAFAADVYSPASYAASPIVYPVATWAGFFIGINGGYGGSTGSEFRNTTFPVATPASISTINGASDIGGGFGGGQLGYNFQYGQFVFGIETDIQGSDIRGRGSETNIIVGTVGRTAAVDLNVDYFGTVRAKLGYSLGNTLLYATGGFAYGGVKSSFSFADTFGNTGTVSHNQTLTGWTAGTGIEVKISPSWSLKGEYQFIDLESSNTAAEPLFAAGVFSGFDQRDKDRVEFHTVRVGLNYYFNTPVEPLPLK